MVHVVSYWESHCSYHPSSAGDTKRSCLLPGLGGLFFRNCFSESSFSTNSQNCDGAGEGLRIERDEASFWELPLSLRHRNMCFPLPLWQTWTTWLSPPTHTCQLVVCQHQAGRTCPTPTNLSPGLVPPCSLPFSRGEGCSLPRERTHKLDAAVQKAAQWWTGCVPSRLCVKWVAHSSLLFKTWQLGVACNQRSFAVEPSNSLVKYQTVIWLVQTSLKLDVVSFRMWLDELESKDLTCFVCFNATIWLYLPFFAMLKLFLFS